jgi:hypothetical protein
MQLRRKMVRTASFKSFGRTLILTSILDTPLTKEASPETPKDTPAAVAAPGDHVVSVDLAQETPKIDLDGDGKNDIPEAPPVSLKITIGADGTVKAVTQTVTVDPPAPSESVAVEKAAEPVVSISKLLLGIRNSTGEQKREIFLG